MKVGGTTPFMLPLFFTFYSLKGLGLYCYVNSTEI